ncbi:MAG: NFACT family protein [Cyanobacteriota bacterium]
MAASPPSRDPIQALDATGVPAVLSELRPALIPSRFEKAQQGDPHTIQLGLRSLEGIHWLELSWLAEAPRLLAIPAPPRQGEGSTLAQQLQHGLRGLALVAMEQQGWERVVELHFARRPGEAAQRFLVLELMGRHSNLFLLDEDRRVIALGRQVRADQSRLRPIGTGDPYGPPPAAAGDPPRLEESEAHWRQRLALVPVPLKRALMEAYQGISPALCRQLVGADDNLLQRNVRDLSPGDWQSLRQRWQAWLEAVAQQRFVLRRGGASDWCCWSEASHEPAVSEPLAINRGLADYYGERLERLRCGRRRHALEQRLRHATEKESREAERQRQLLAAVAGSDGLQRQADALLCLPNPDRSQVDAAQKLYRQARRLRRSVAAITPRLEQHEQRLAALEASLIYLDQAEGEAPLQALEEELDELLGLVSRRRGGPTGRAERRRHEAGASGPVPLELRTGAGLRVQVGRNHRQNEWISLRQARRGDLWFHAQECPGSHVVLKGSEAPPGEADRLAAADLAAHFSRARGNARVPVVMVPTDELQRIPGAGPGTVRHRGGEVLWGEPARALPLLRPPNLNGEERP